MTGAVETSSAGKPKPARAKPYPANTVDLQTGKRSRIFHKSHLDAKIRAARDLAHRAMLVEKLGDRTFACAAADMRAGFVEKGEHRLVYKIDRAMNRQLGALCGNVMLRTIDRHIVKQIADKLAIRFENGETRAFFEGWLCRIIRHGFGDLEPPIRTPGDIPGHRRARLYGRSGPQFNDRPIPYGREITDRLVRSSGVIRILLHLLIRCGLRIGEALALRRCDVVFADANGKPWLHVRKSQDRRGERGETKTRAGKRLIPLPVELVEELRAWFASHPAGPREQLITDTPGRRYLYGTVSSMHDTFQKSLGGRRFGFHRYRAGCVTAWLVSGVKLQNIQNWIGHSSIQTTVMIYASALAFADELWWRVHEKGRYNQSPGERVRLSLVIGGKPEPDRTVYNGRSSADGFKKAA